MFFKRLQKAESHVPHCASIKIHVHGYRGLTFHTKATQIASQSFIAMTVTISTAIDATAMKDNSNVADLVLY